MSLFSNQRKLELEEEIKARLHQSVKELESIHAQKLEALKATYLKELKLVREQAKGYQAALKVRDKLIRKMLGVITTQEYQISTQDYHLMMEFQRDRRVNMLDLIDLKKQASKNED